MKRCVVNMIWCDESKTWIADSDDVPGLALGSESYDKLVGRVRSIAPELLEENTGYTGAFELLFISERVDIMAAVS